ncbi:DEAD-domain-containing protein [Serendipita vermifera]|nr:DEAD-domain-containing protein [Serendipita vermifera]
MTTHKDDSYAKRMDRNRSLKRKLLRNGEEKPKKRQKVVQDISDLDELDWKVVERPAEAGIDEAGGMLMLEEVEGVDVCYEDTPKGRVARFKQANQKIQKSSGTRIQAEIEDVGDVSESGDQEEETEFDDLQLPEWMPFELPKSILRRLHDLAFTSPTPIQKETLPQSMSGRDVIGIAQTGSGKTLAFSLPIVTSILKSKRERKRRLKALILEPTRELALQVAKHIKDCSPQRSEAQVKAHAAPIVSVATVVGGMSSQKQSRILDRGADILVATPGRLWEMLSVDDDLAMQLKHLQFLVLDEADRMIENGHFAELDKIIRLTARAEVPIEGQMAATSLESGTSAVPRMQTFVFSATMSKELQQNLKKYRSLKKKGEMGSTIEDLIMKLDFRDDHPVVVDLSPSGGVVATFQESKIECLSADKDTCLYYFLLRYPGRSIVFLSSIDGIRRILPMLELLKLKVWPLHSQMEQRQRLKNLERFKSHSDSILLATDVAARGLDIPFVDHVIHYQVPRSADTYVHRNGRTARAERPGFGLLLCAPDEKKPMRALFTSLGRKDDEVPEVLVERDLFDKLKQRVSIAREIDKIHHSSTKKKHENNWLKVTAEALEIELSDEETIPEERNKDEGVKIRNLKHQLNQLLTRPLMAKGISAKFITSGSHSVVDELLHGTSHEQFLGLRTTTAQEDIIDRKKLTKEKRLAKVVSR